MWIVGTSCYYAGIEFWAIWALVPFVREKPFSPSATRQRIMNVFLYFYNKMGLIFFSCGEYAGVTPSFSESFLCKKVFFIAVIKLDEKTF